MKRLSLILLMFLYLAPTVGFSVTAHYCGGRLASLSLTTSNDEACACGSKKTKKSCCENKIISVKIKDSQQTPVQLNPDFKAFQFQPLFVATQEFNFQTKLTVSSFYLHHHPPDELKQPLFLLNRVFRI